MSPKLAASTSSISDNSHSPSTDLHLESKLRTIRQADTVGAGAAVLAFLSGLAVVGAAGDVLRVYNETHLPAEHWLPLWPADLNAAPTVALVAAGAVVAALNAVDVAFWHVGSLRARTALHQPLTLVLPLLSFIAALVAISVYYAADASGAQDTALSWTCRWRDIPMSQEPRWGPLCAQSRAALYLAVMLVPLEAGALAVAAVSVKVQKYVERYLEARKTPVLN